MSTRDLKDNQIASAIFKGRTPRSDLDRIPLRDIALHFQNDSALLRYLLFCSVGNISLYNNSVSHSIIQPKNKPNRNPVFVDTLLTTVDEASNFHFTPEGAVRPPRMKTTNSASIGFQSSFSTREAPPTTMQSLTSRNSMLEKLLAVEVANYTYITLGIHSRYFFLYYKIRQLEVFESDTIIGRFLLWNLCSTPEK